MRSPYHERSGRAYPSSNNKKMHQHACNVSAQASPSLTWQPRFYWVLVTWAPFASCVPKFQILRRKAGVQHNPYCLHKQSRHNESPLSVTGNAVRTKFPDASRGPTLQAGLSKDSNFRLFSVEQVI